MSSRRALRPRFVRSAVSRLAVAALLLLTVQACGRKGDPQPPPQKHPARTTDLRVEQRGQELILSMSYPTMTVGGLALPGIDRLELVQYTRPAPEFMEQPDAEVESELGAEPTSEPESDIEATEAEPAVSPAPAGSESAEGEIVVEDLTTEEVGSLETAPTGEAGTATEAEADADDDADTDTDVLVPEEPNPFLMIRVADQGRHVGGQFGPNFDPNDVIILPLNF